MVSCHLGPAILQDGTLGVLLFFPFSSVLEVDLNVLPNKKRGGGGVGVGDKPDLYLATLQRCMSRTLKEVFSFSFFLASDDPKMNHGTKIPASFHARKIFCKRCPLCSNIYIFFSYKMSH